METPKGTECGKDIFGCAIPSLDAIRRSVVKYLGHENFLMEVGALHCLANVKEHATLSARARVDHGVEVECRKGHENRAADRGCVSRLVRLGSFLRVCGFKRMQPLHPE